MYDDAKGAQSSNNHRTQLYSRRKLDEQELNNLHPQLRSKYLAVRTMAYFTFLI